MAKIENSDIEQALANIIKNKSLDRILNEEQQDVSKYLTAFSNRIKEATDAVKLAETAFENITNKTAIRMQNEKAVYEKFHKQLLEILSKTDEKQQAEAYDKLKNEIEALTDITDDSRIALKEFISIQEEVSILKKEEAEALKSEQKHRNMLERIKTSSQSNVSSLFKAIGLSYEGDPHNVNALFKGLSLIRDGEVQEGINSLSAYADMAATAYKNMLDPLNIAVNMLGLFKTKTLEMFLQVDAITANFLKSTGATSKFTDVLMDAWDLTRNSSISLQEMSDTVKDLMENYRGFTLASKESQVETSVFTSLVARLGAGTTNAAKIFSYFSDTLKLGVTESKRQFSSLLGLVKTTGDSIQKVTSDFIASLPVMGRYGSQASEIFKKVYATAKSLRIETSQLLEIASHFDTYEDAAQSVGKLNAIMGGPYLNAIDLMNKDHAEVVTTLNQAFKATGKSWEALGKYGRMAFAAAAGISDMDLAQKLFNGSTADAARLMRQASLEQEELAAKNKRATDIAELWKNVLMQIGAVLNPLIEAVHWLVGGILSISDALGKVSGPLRVLTIPLLFLLTSVLAGVGSGIFSLSKKAALAVAGGLGSFFTKTSQIVEKTNEVAPSVSKIATAFKGLSFVGGILGGIATGITAIGSSLIGVMAALGKASPVIAGGILLIGGAISVVQGLSHWLSESPSEELEDLIDTVSEAGPDIGRKMRDIGKGVADLVGKFNSSISQSTVESFTNLIESIADNSSRMSNIVAASVIQAYSNLADSFGDLSITPTKVTEMKQFTDNLVTLTDNTKSSGVIPFIEAVDKMFKSMNKSQNEKSRQNIEIKVFIDGKELKDKLVKTTINQITDQLRPRETG